MLDVKPYLPRYDSLPSATVPDWIDDDDVSRPKLGVSFSDEAERMLACVRQDVPLQYYHRDEMETLKLALVEVLSLDIRSVHQRNVGKQLQGLGVCKEDSEVKNEEKTADALPLYRMRFDRLEVEFKFPAADEVLVTNVHVWVETEDRA